MATGIRLGTMYWETDLDSSGLQRGLDRSEAGVQQFANNASSGFSALAVAAGTLLAGAVEKLAGGIMAIGKNAIGATADMQAMQVGLEGLLAREIARGEEATRTYQVTSSLNADEQQKVTDLTLKLDAMNAKLQEKKQHLWEIKNRWTDEGLAAQTAAADIAVYENNIAKTAAQLEALKAKQGQVNTVTEKYWINTTSISDALPIAQEKAKGLMDELARIAILSPYQVESVQSTFKQAMAFGFGSEEASKFTSAIMNVAAGTGASNEMLQRMGYNLAQVGMQGRVTAVDIRQLAMAGFDLNGVLRSVGEQFGVNIRTHDDFNRAIANGSITWEQFTDGFAKYADNNFGGASERMSRTLNGLKSTFSDLFTLTMPKVVGPALEEITGLLNDMLSSFLKIRESGVLDEMGQKLGNMAKGLVSGLRGLTKLPGVLKELRSLDPNDFAGIYYVLEQLPEGLRGLAKGLNDLAGAFEEGGLAGVFGELFDMAVDWWQSGGSEWLGSMVTAAWEWIQKIPGEIAAKVKDLADDATQILRNVWEALYKWWDTGGSEWVSTTADTVWGYVTQLPGKIAEKVGDFVTGAKEWLVNAWNAIHEWWDSGGEAWATETARKVWDAVQKLPGKIGELLTSAGMEVGGWLADVWINLNSWWDNGGETWATETAEKIGTAIDTLRSFLTGEDAPQVLKDAANWLEPVWMQMATWWENSAEPLVNDMLTGFDNWMNTQFVPALQNQDKSTWARGVADALASGFDQAVAYLSEPIYIEKIAYAIGNFLTQVLIDLSFLPLGFLQLVFDAIFGGGDGEEVDTSRAEEWVLGLVNGLLMGIQNAFIDSPVIQSVIDWFGRMIDGIKEFLGIASPSTKMMEIGVDIINGMLAGIASMATATMTTVQNFVTDNIVKAVNWTTRLVEVGKDMIAGLIKGLGEKKQDVINWILGLVGDIVAAVKRMLGIESPSRVFAEVGRYIIEGLIEGIKTTTPAAVAAMAEMIDKVMGALNSVVGGVSAVLNMGEIGDILPKLRILVEHVKSVISILSDLAGYYANSQALNRAARVIEPLADIASGLRSVVEAASSIAAASLDIKPSDLANMGAVLSGLFDLIGQVIGETVDLAAGYNVNQLIQATMLAETIWPVLEAFGLAAELIEPLTRVSPASIETKATALVAAMGALIKKITALAADIPPEVLANSARVAEKIIAALKPWEVMIDAYNAFADLVLRSGIGAKANALTTVVERLILKITWLANSIGEDTLENSARVASMIVTALKPWKDMIASYTALAELVISSGIGEKANALAVVVERLVLKITWLANSIGEDILVNSARVGELVIAALEPWKEMVDAVNAVGSFTQIEGVGDKARLLTDAVEVLATALSTMADRLGIEVLEKAQRVGRLLSDVLAPWEKAIKVSDEMRAWVIMPDLEERFIRFARQWVTIVESLSEAVGVLTEDGMEAVAAFGITLEALMGGLQEALVLAVNLPATWSEPVSWDAFVSWVQDAFMEFYSWLNGWGGGDTRPPVPFFDDGALDLVGRFGEVLGQLMGGLQAALDLALALPATWSEPPSWDAFVTWVQDVFVYFFNWISSWGSSEPGSGPPVPNFEDGDLDLVGLFGDALGALMGGLQQALALALALPAEWTEPASWTSFAEWVQDAFLLFMAWVDEHFPTPEDPDAPDQFGAILGFSQALGALMGGLQAALAVALALPAEWTEPPSWDNFAAWVQGVFVEFVAWVNTAFPMRLNPDDGDIFGAVAAFGEALGALMDGLSAALGLALALPETWTAPTSEMWDAFFGWVTDVFDAFMDYVALNYPQDPDEASQFEPIAAFGGAMQAVFDGLLAALDLFTDLANWAGPSSTFNTRLQNFLGAVSTAISDIAAFIAADPNLDPENMASVTIFGDALSSLVGGLSDALDLFAQLADTDPSVYTESTLFEDRVGNLLLAIGGTLNAFSEWITGPEGEVAWTEDAGDFYDAIEAVFNILSDALGFFIDLEENGMPPTPEIQAFVTAITDLFDTVAIQLGGLAAPGGALTLAIAAVDGVVSGFPATMDTHQQAWWTAAGALAARIPAALVASVGSATAANTLLWGLDAIKHEIVSFSGWWVPNVAVPAWYDAGVDFAQALVDGMMSQTAAVFAAGEALAQAGLDGFNAGAGLGSVMEGMTMDMGEGGGWTMDTTHRWEISLVGVGSPTGHDLSFAAVDQITDMLRTKLARGG